MALEEIAEALQRAEKVLSRKPQLGIHDDAPATARWKSGVRVIASHANGLTMQTDMPADLGGTGDQVTPGWLFRAGLASCMATCIAMGAAAQGIELSELEVKASSRSDTRGLLGMADDEGKRVCAAPREVQMHVRIAAHGVSPQRLRALVEESQRCSPVPTAVQNALPVALLIDVDDA